MHSGIGADVRPVIDGDMTGQRGGVSHNHVIADQTVMRDMHLGHQEAIVANLRNSSTTGGAAVHGTNSRIRVRLPIWVSVDSPANFKSCGGKPSDTNG